ncbi:MAG TPA: malonyl-CoA decarboxylase family protein [Candidatus Baltobacteraceae bacterium]|nr:malonyl-CoA decarboxylase family protein [Candidatus Baltobacteraceae bacterium]
MPPREPAVDRAFRELSVLPVGDLAAREPVRVVVAAVATADDDDLLRILRLLDALDVDPARVDPALALAVTTAPRERREALAKLRQALEPARSVVLRHLAAPPGSLRLLVDLRASLLRLVAARPDAADLKPLGEELRQFLAARFEPSALELRQLTWSDSAELLERLARSEAVHAVRGWSDLKDRLDVDRRVFALFHPALPGSPLVFIEVALTDEMSGSIRSILKRDAPRVDPATARCAIFYSISSCEPGLAAIPLGNALIKRAVERLRAELPKLRTFSTLSPIPGFAAWVRSLGERVPLAVREALATTGWHRDPARAAALREPLLRLAARYLLEAKRADGAPRDAVARFHLANGAVLERLDWLGDPSAHGLAQSYGMMVNYRYALERLATNQLAYASEHRIDASPAVRVLAEADDVLADVPRAPRWRAVTAPLAVLRTRAQRLLRRMRRASAEPAA